MKKKIIKIKGLELHKRQEQIKDDIINSNKKFYIINSSRQAGKTCLLEQLSLYFSISDKGTNTLWVSPSYSITKKSFINIIDNIIESGIIRSYSKAEQSIELINNSRIFFKSGNNFDMIRGGSYDYCFIDEMSYIEEEAFTKAIRPTLSVKGKKCIIASTPKGKNYFHNLSMLGQNPDEENYSYYYMNYKDNPYYDLLEVEDARKVLPESVFNQEYEGMFVDDAGQIFNNLIELSTLTSWIEPVRNVRYYAGLDLGRQVDYTVLIIIDEFGKVCYIYRDNQKTWSLLQHNIISVLNKYHPQLLMEINSIGDVLYEQIKKEYNIVEPFITSQKSKEELIENLIYMFNDKKIQIPSKNFYPELYNELSIFGFEYNKHTRTIKYGAPPGFHDDLIISLGLAFKAFKSKKSGKIYIERF